VSWLLFLFLAQSEYRGTLAPELVVEDGTHMANTFTLATPEERKPLGDAQGKVFVGKIQGALAFLVEGQSTALYVDTGRLTKYALRSGDDALIADVGLPLPGPIYKSYPVRVWVYHEQNDPDRRIVGESPRAFVAGSVTINGREIPVAFEFDRVKNTAFADQGWQSIDGDPAFVEHERPVYHAGGAYFSVRSVDVPRRAFSLDARTAAEYTRIVLKIGEVFPDFAFTDFEGRAHKLSDYAGRPVLLDFWATWCAPCMADLPKLDELHGRGMAIVGMNVDQDPEKARALHLGWPQAAFPSIREIVERRARIQNYPTDVLLDGDRRIVALNEDALK
jgi:thiol-disulfide isomerase/thioredoxin